MIGEFIAANTRHLCTAVRLWLALVLMLLAACCLTLPPHASLLDLLREYAATSGGIFPVSVLSWKTLFFAVLLGLAFVPHALGALWNAVLGIAFPLSLGWLTCMVFGPHLLLPAPLDSCREAVAFMQMPDTDGAMVSLALCACILALLCAATRVRVLVTVLVSLALWFVLSDMLWWWLAGDVSPDSLLYDVAQPVKFHPWICALLPGIFFGVFALAMCILQAFTNRKRPAKAPDSLPEPEPAPEPEPQAEAEQDITPAEIEPPAKPAAALPEPTVVDAEVVEDTPVPAPSQEPDSQPKP